ncbi:MAG: FAD:protein FMN transferase [Gemmataceae bacterium]|nr:FAD:protein FMN transferase [Gemmataceae bacterium]
MRFLCGLICGLATASVVGAAEPALSRYSFTEPHMGTRFTITLYAPDEATANKASKAAFERIAALDGIMSDYKPTSELMKLCAKAGGDPIVVSEDLFTVLARAQEVSKKSDGAFDVTVGPLVRLWRRARRTQELPATEALDKAKALVGYDKVRLDAKERTVQLATAGMLLDLGGIAKGYAADAALLVLKKHGITRGLVAAGGDVAVSGAPPDAEGWSVAVEPLGKDQPARTLILRDASVSTSGDSEQFVEIAGKRYSHIVDPKTGLGLLGRMSVTVVAPNGLTSDPYTKVVAILGQERGIPIIDAMHGVSCYGVRKTDQGQDVFQSKRFKDVLQKKEPERK